MTKLEYMELLLDLRDNETRAKGLEGITKHLGSRCNDELMLAIMNFALDDNEEAMEVLLEAYYE
jgi:hypothetical protein